MFKSYHIDLPYPDVVVDRRDYRDACCLKGDFGGAESETTAIMQYVCQSYSAGLIDKSLHEFFIGIAITEMHHHELLGETLCKLGDKPLIADCRRFWNAGNVNYTTNIIEMLTVDIQNEKQAIRNYRNTIKCLNNLSIIELVERIILDEEYHVELLEDKLCEIREGCSCK